MGGYGSGRWSRWGSKETVDGCKRVDVRYLQRNGLLRPGGRFTLFWTRRGEPASDITLYPSHDHVLLSYRSRRNDEPWQDVRYPVPLDRTPCHYGGSGRGSVAPASSRGCWRGRRGAAQVRSRLR